MKLTIIPIDKAVYVNNESRLPLDLISCNIPVGVHALQWFETRGWIEFEDDGDPFTPKKPNENIDVLPEWANACYEVWVNSPPPEPPLDVIQE